MKNIKPLIPGPDEKLDQIIWEELRMITLFLADIKISLEENKNKISDIENRMVSTYDFNNGIDKICNLLKSIQLNTSSN